MATQTLERDFSFYKKNKPGFKKKYLGKFLVIFEQKIVSVHESAQEAYLASLKSGLALGTFLIQEVTADSSDTEQTFHSRVSV